MSRYDDEYDDLDDELEDDPDDETGSSGSRGSSVNPYSRSGSSGPGPSRVTGAGLPSSPQRPPTSSGGSVPSPIRGGGAGSSPGSGSGSGGGYGSNYPRSGGSSPSGGSGSGPFSRPGGGSPPPSGSQSSGSLNRPPSSGSGSGSGSRPSSGDKGQSGGGLLGGLTSKIGGKKDDKPARPFNASASSSSSGGGLGRFMPKLGGDKGSKPAQSKSPTPNRSGGGAKAGLGGILGRLKGGGKSSSPSAQSSARPGASSTPFGGGSSSGSGFGGSRPMGGGAPSSSSKAPAARSAGGGGGIGAKLRGLFSRGPQNEKAARARASKAPRVDQGGLSLDNKLDILGVSLVLGALVVVLSSLSPTKGALTDTVNTFLSQTFGWGAIAVPITMFAIGIWLILRHFGDEAPVLEFMRLVGIVMGYIGLLVLFQFIDSLSYTFESNTDSLMALRSVFLPLSYSFGRGGGWIGAELYYLLVSNFTEIGGFFIMLGWLIVALMLTLRLSASELAIITIGTGRSFNDARKRRNQRRAVLLAERQTAAASGAPQIGISKPVDQLPLPRTPALPASADDRAEERSIPITMGGRTISASFRPPEQVELEEGAVAQTGRAASSPAASTAGASAASAGGRLGGFGAKLRGALPIGAKLIARQGGEPKAGGADQAASQPVDAQHAGTPTAASALPAAAPAAPSSEKPETPTREFERPGRPGGSSRPGESNRLGATNGAPVGGAPTRRTFGRPLSDDEELDADDDDLIIDAQASEADEKPQRLGDLLRPTRSESSSAAGDAPARSSTVTPFSSPPGRPAPYRPGTTAPSSAAPKEDAAKSADAPARPDAPAASVTRPPIPRPGAPASAPSRDSELKPPLAKPGVPKPEAVRPAPDLEDVDADETIPEEWAKLPPAQPKGRVTPGRGASSTEKPAIPDLHSRLSALRSGRPLGPTSDDSSTTETGTAAAASPTSTGSTQPADEQTTAPAASVTSSSPTAPSAPQETAPTAPAAAKPEAPSATSRAGAFLKDAVKSLLPDDEEDEIEEAAPAASKPSSWSPFRKPDTPPVAPTAAVPAAPRGDSPNAPGTFSRPTSAPPSPQIPIRDPGRSVAGAAGGSVPTPPSVSSSAARGRGKHWEMPEYAPLLASGQDKELNHDQLLERARLIEETLAAFGAPGRVVEVRTGPVITQFGVEPDYITVRGGKKIRVKVSAIAGLDKDLQLALGAKSIRIEAPVPGKGYVGIEVPNDEAAVVSLRDVLESNEFKKVRSPLAIALGQGVDGTPVAADLGSMPHLLIAGTTGSGKSVCVNAIIASLLLRNTPDKLKFIMVDPKRVELTAYNGIPHLVAPVVVELERIVGVLKWVTREMDERYRRFSSAGARNIEDYNRHVPSGEQPIPYIVVIIDELADLMMLAPDETERVITRIAALARATGIHLVIATQRPSVDVVTGLIKANFPARIAFAVAGSVDSRVILDQPGADRLLGRGDMLYMSGDSPAPVRLQGVFVSDTEINNITRFWRSQMSDADLLAAARHLPTSAASDDAGRGPGPSGPSRQQAFWDRDGTGQSAGRADEPEDDEDAMYEEAVELVRRLNKASVSLLQRRLRIGYTRAARLIDMMEERGIVGPPTEGSKPREVLPVKD